MDNKSPLIGFGFLSEIEKASIFGMKIIKLITGAVLLLCFLILAYVIWSDSLQLNEIALENSRIENTLGKILYNNIDIKHHIKQINNDIGVIEGEYKAIEGKSSLKSFVSNTNTMEHELLLNEDASKQLADWINDGDGRNKSFKLIYKASRDGDSAKTFHEKVDDIAPTISLFKTNDAFFGGYTSKSWKGNEENEKDEDAFLFSLDKNKMYPVSYAWNALYKRASSLGYYGNQDLIIKDNCLNPLTNNYSNFPNNYGGNSKELELTNGKRTFYLTELEVYQVIDN